MAARFTPPSPGKVIALDLETLRRARDWSEADKRDMGIACCGVEDVDSGQTAAFVDANVVSKIARNCGNLADLQAALNKAAVIVTFGGGNQSDKGFDFCVIEGASLTVDRSRSFDIRLEVKSRCAQQGITPSGSITLGSLAQANACPEYPSLGQGKTGAGADAPERWAAGEYEAVIDYCLDDVKMTADLYRLWTSRGYLVLPDGQRVGFTNEEIYATDSRAAGGDAGNSGGRGDGAGRVPEPQSAASKHAAGQGVGDSESVASQPEPAQSVASADKSVSPVAQTDRADKSAESADKSVSKVLDFSGFKARRLTSQSVADFDKKHWKRSRIKPGWLIRRLTGYSIVENEYGVQYLGVVSRKPDRMSADSLEYPLAGFFIWSVMAERSLLVEERGQHARAKLG